MANTKLSLGQIVKERAAVFDNIYQFMNFSFASLKKIENQSTSAYQVNLFQT